MAYKSTVRQSENDSLIFANSHTNTVHPVQVQLITYSTKNSAKQKYQRGTSSCLVVGRLLSVSFILRQILRRPATQNYNNSADIRGV